MRGGVRLVLVAMTLPVAACHDVPDNGHYRFVVNHLLEDGCGLMAAPPSPGLLWEGDFRRAGSVVILPLEHDGLELRGYYLYQSYRFSADGTVEQVATQVNGHGCVADWVGAHLDGNPVSPTEFSGGVTVTYQSELDEACRCRSEATYNALLQ